MVKKNAKLLLIRWILLLKEFDLVIYHNGTKNKVADHLSHLSNELFLHEKKDIENCLPDEQLFRVEEREP